MSVVCDGQQHRAFASVWNLAFSRDGRLAYCARTDKASFVVRGGLPGREYGDVGSPRWSPAGNRLAYTARRKGRPLVVVDCDEGRRYDAIPERSLAWSRDGAHLAYVAKRSGKWTIVVDGVERGWYEALILRRPIRFDGPDRLHALARRGGEILRVDVQILHAPGPA